MNTIQAEKLYFQFEKYADPNSSIKPQLLKLFVPVFWDGSIVLRTSWKGWIASLLERPSEYLANNSKIYGLFSNAMQTLFKHQDYYQKLNPALAFKIFDELGMDSHSLPLIGCKNFSPSEIETLQEIKENRNSLYCNKIRS